MRAGIAKVDEYQLIKDKRDMRDVTESGDHSLINRVMQAATSRENPTR